MPLRAGELPAVVLSPEARQVTISESPLYLFILRYPAQVNEGASPQGS
jgi:hypothetical protein